MLYWMNDVRCYWDDRSSHRVSRAVSGARWAMHYTAQGMQVAGIGRDAHALQRLQRATAGSTGTLHAFVADIRDRDSMRRARIGRRSSEILGPIGLAIANAGVGDQGRDAQVGR